MEHKTFTVDSVIRTVTIIICCILGWLIINYLSNVLVPFFVAWLIAYMLYPLVIFLQKKVHLHFRILSIAVSLVLVFGIIASVLAVVIPSTLDEAGRVIELAQNYFNESISQKQIDQAISFIQKSMKHSSVIDLIQNKDIGKAVQAIASLAWSMAVQAVDLLVGVMDFFLILLYTIFILLDYERISDGWVTMIPASKRSLAQGLVDDVKSGMSSYFRGQSLIALIVGILFSIGFSIIGLPMAVGLGMFIGFLNLVPYLQVIGIVPAIFLALLKSIDTGQSFWSIMFLAFLVFLVVQTIQDLYLTPRIMSKVMGLKPAIILLSLSVWGALLGIIGLIIALPLTTLTISYYRRFVLHENRGISPTAEEQGGATE